MARPTTTLAREVVIRALRSSSELAWMQERVDELLPHAEQVRLAAGEVLFAAGDPALELHIVVEGALQVVATGADGRELVLRRLEAGAVLGEQAVLAAAPGRRPETVRAAQSTMLVRLGRDAFRPGAGDDPVQRRLREIGWGYARDQLAGESAFAPLLGLDAGARERTVGAGETLFEQGDEADRVYLVVAGTAAVYKERGDRRTLIGRAGAGRCVGELALVRRARRGTTVVADTDLRVLEVDGARFLDLLESEPQLREHMQALERVYHLPGRGVMTQHSGKVLGEDAITTLYHLADGRRLAASRIVARDLYHLERVDPPATEVELRTAAHGDCELAFHAAGAIVRITSASTWADLPRAHMLALDGVALSAAEAQAFERSGELPPAPATATAILCSCVQVTTAAVDAAIRDGCSTTAALERALACATVCGACLPRLAERVAEAAWTPVEVAGERRLTGDVHALRLRPAAGAVKRWRAGQHVVVGGRIEGHWVDRRYTITAAPGDDELEIVVKREPRGLLSNWLFDERTEHDRLRVGEPQGEPAWELGDEPALCFVAGIGVTPAIAACRALGGSTPLEPIHVDCSCRDAAELPGLDELRAWDGATVDIRETATHGRLTAADVRELVALHPGARVLVCGPPGYMRDVGLFLRTAGVPADRIHVEAFTHAGAPIVRAGSRARPRRAPGEPDGSTDYERYLHTEELLALQVGPDTWAHPDELLFQTVHQASELWLKHAHAELAQAADDLAGGDIAPALRRLRRAAEGMRNATASLDMLEQMSPWEYHEVRKALGQGSGFDSPGFRRIRDVSPRLGARFHALREAAGLSLLAVYTLGREHEQLYQLAEHLIEWDERVTLWRMRHLKVVERIIGGSAVGTQGTPVEVLGKLIFTSFYPELWQVRNELTAHSNLKPVPLAPDEPG